MSSNPNNCLILFCPFVPNQPISNVDQVVSYGTSGQIALEKTLSDNSVILQLLGLYDATLDRASFKAKFNQRFQGLSLAIVSDQTSTVEIARELECHHDGFKSINQVLELLHTVNVLFIDFTNNKQAWSITDSILENPLPNTLKCVISPCTTNIFTNATADYINSNHIFIPKQSYTFKNGYPVSIDDTKSLICSYLHINSTRKDAVTKHNSQEIQQHGGNQIILAWHFLAEIGHKLGFVSKYGA